MNVERISNNVGSMWNAVSSFIYIFKNMEHKINTTEDLKDLQAIKNGMVSLNSFLKEIRSTTNIIQNELGILERELDMKE